MARVKSIAQIEEQINRIRKTDMERNGGELSARGYRAMSRGREYQYNIATRLQQNGYKVYDDNYNYKHNVVNIPQAKAVYAASTASSRGSVGG